MNDRLPDDVSPSDVYNDPPEKEREEFSVVVSYYREQDEAVDNPKEKIKDELNYSTSLENPDVAHIDVKENNNLELIADIYIAATTDIPTSYTKREKKRFVSDEIDVKNDSMAVVDVEFN